MTVFYAYAEVPADVQKVWEIDPADDDGRPWIRHEAGGPWSVEGETILQGGLVLTWEQLMENFGPLTDDPAMAGVGLEALPSTAAATVPDELRQAAGKLTNPPHCGGRHTDCACDYAEQLAGLFRDIAARLTAEPGYPVPETALDMARRINKTEVSR